MTTDTLPAAALTSDVTPEDAAAAAEAHRRAAREAAAQAEQDRGEAGPLVAAAEAEAARIMREARQRAGELSRSAACAEAEILDLEFRARALQAAADSRTEAAEADGQAAALAAERDERAAEAQGIGERLLALAAEREQAESGLGACRDAGDLDGLAAARARIGAIDELAASLAPVRDAAAARVAAIGTGQAEILPAATPQKELATVLARAGHLRAEVTRNLHVASLGERGAAAEALRAVPAGDAPPARAPRTQVYLPGTLGLARGGAASCRGHQRPPAGAGRAGDVRQAPR